MKHYSLSKEDRLSSDKAILKLFSEGFSLFKYPIRLTFLCLHDDTSTPMAQAAFSVPKKRFKRAVKRNLLKRRMREAYRQLKPLILEDLGQMNKKVIFMLIYAGTEVEDFRTISNSLKQVLDEMIKRICNEKNINNASDTSS